MLRFSGAGVSDVGRVRPHNEDSGFVGPYVVLVADGVGGAAAGEIASATAAYSASAVALGWLGQSPEQVLAEAYAAAAAGVRMGVQRDLERLGMATTLTMLVTDGRDVALGHVGDSRGYLFRDGSLRQITKDHTYVQHLIDTGQLTPEDRAVHPVAQRRAPVGRRRPGRRRTRHRAPRRGGRRPAAAGQRRPDRPGAGRRDRRRAGVGGGRGRRGDPHPAGPRPPAAATTSPSSSSTWSTGRAWSATAGCSARSPTRRTWSTRRWCACRSRAPPDRAPLTPAELLPLGHFAA